jgi:hypothetical protein
MTLIECIKLVSLIALGSALLSGFAMWCCTLGVGGLVLFFSCLFIGLVAVFYFASNR